MNEQVYADVMQRLDALAAQLGVAAGEVWPILIRQMELEGWLGVALCVVGCGLAGSGAALGRKTMNGGFEGAFDGEGLCFAAAALCGVFAMLAFGFGAPLAMRGLNPEYYALRDIVAVLQ